MQMKHFFVTTRQHWLCCAIGIVLPATMLAQGKQIHGVVRDETGQPVIGATVVQKGTKYATVTDLNGNFNLSSDADGTLVITYMGYATQEIKMSGQQVLDVSLQPDNHQLNEVVVVGYGTMRKSDLTGAVGSLGSKTIGNQPVGNIGQALQGRIAGLQVVDAGKPGDNVSIKIRGLGSINNCDPLVVIDGVPTDLGLNSLNMADVERVDVLKDASATAIYGSRGANGVIMVTTKKGTTGEGRLNVSVNASMQQVTRKPKLLNAAQYAALNNDMMRKIGRAHV